MKIIAALVCTYQHRCAKDHFRQWLRKANQQGQTAQTAGVGGPTLQSWWRMMKESSLISDRGHSPTSGEWLMPDADEWWSWKCGVCNQEIPIVMWVCTTKGTSLSRDPRDWLSSTIASNYQPPLTMTNRLTITDSMNHSQYDDCEAAWPRPNRLG